MPLGTEMMADFLVSGKILSSFLVDNNKIIKKHLI